MAMEFRLANLVNSMIIHDLGNALNIFSMASHCVASIVGGEDKLLCLIDDVGEKHKFIEQQYREGKPFDEDIFNQFHHSTLLMIKQIDHSLAALPSDIGDDDLRSEVSNTIHRINHFLVMITNLINDEIPPAETIRAVDLLHSLARLAKYKEQSVEVSGGEFEVVAVDVVVVSILEQFVRNAIDEVSEMDHGIIEANAVVQGQSAVFTISDNGRGMSAEQLQNLFTGKSTKSGENRGLGLGIAKSLATRCGYSIFADSQPGQGTRMSLVVPLVGGVNGL